MRINNAMVAAAAALHLASSAAVSAADGADATDDIAALRRDIQTLKQDYRRRIDALERRLAAATRAAKEAKAQATEARRAAEEVSLAPASGAAQGANAFNPAIGLVLVGNLRTLQRNPARFAVPGFALDEAGLGDDGFSLGESELNLNASIDNLFYGNFTLAVAESNGDSTVELEEAWMQTLALPRGLTLRGGRFFSGIGYLNGFHTHADDFADRPLPYRVFLDGQYADDGVQLRWLAPSARFIELGAEWVRGASFPASGNAHRGKGAWTVFGHIGGDIGESSSWRAGLGYLAARAHARITGGGDRFDGDSDLLLADFVWKWAPHGNPYARNFKLQGELFWRHEDGRFLPAGGRSLAYGGDQLGAYLQAVYQFMPRWRTGARLAALDAEDPGAAFAGTTLDPRGRTPWRATLMADWSNSEFSRIRLQYAHDASQLTGDEQVVLQYLVSLGAHGAHQF